MLCTAELHWESSGFSTALPLLLQALALARQHHLQSLASETILHLAFTQVSDSRETALTQTLLQLPFITRALICMVAIMQNKTRHRWAHSVYYLWFLFIVQLMLGVPEQALSVLHEAIEPVLAHGSVMDKGRALLLTAHCQMAVAGFKPNGQGQAGNGCTAPWTLISLSKCHLLHTAAYCLFADLHSAALAVDTLNEAAAYFSKLNCKERLRDIHYLQAQLHRSLGQTSQCNKSAMLFRLLDQELQSPAPPVSMRL